MRHSSKYGEVVATLAGGNIPSSQGGTCDFEGRLSDEGLAQLNSDVQAASDGRFSVRDEPQDNFEIEVRTLLARYLMLVDSHQNTGQRFVMLPDRVARDGDPVAL